MLRGSLALPVSKASPRLRGAVLWEETYCVLRARVLSCRIDVATAETSLRPDKHQPKESTRRLAPHDQRRLSINADTCKFWTVPLDIALLLVAAVNQKPRSEGLASDPPCRHSNALAWHGATMKDGTSSAFLSANHCFTSLNSLFDRGYVF